MSLASSLLEADRSILYLINKKLSFSELDTIMLLLREPLTWVPLYLFFLLFFYANCRKYLLPIVILSVLTFAVSDFTSASIIKPLIGRLRPCHDATLGFALNNIAGCGGPYSMPSSHATNHFGLATFWFLVIRNTLNLKWHWLFVWAFLVCYAQVYVGVHFPGDVTVGGLLGIGVAYCTYYVFCRWIELPNTKLETGV